MSDKTREVEGSDQGGGLAALGEKGPRRAGGGEGAARWAGQLDSERGCCVADGAAVMLAGLLRGGRVGRAAAAGGAVARLLRSGRCFCAARVCGAAVMR